jgi:hypothetical protein
MLRRNLNRHFKRAEMPLAYQWQTEPLAYGIAIAMTTSPNELDRWILARAQVQWRKVAYIIASVGHEVNATTDAEYEAIAGRIAALVRIGRLEAQGDLARWRHSEVRLPGG